MKPRIGAFAWLGALSVAAVGLSLMQGSSGIPLARLVDALRGGSEGEWVRAVLFDVRLPRTIVGYLVGAALALSGCALQGMFRNPLADPAVLGVSACAALGAQAVIFLGAARHAAWLAPLAATIGAVVAMLAIVAFLGRLHHASLDTIVLGGVALGQIAIAASSLLVSLALADFTIARQLLHWLLGTLDGRTWMHVMWGLGPIVGGAALLLTRARALDALLLGDVTAAALGVSVARLRRELVLLTGLLTGVSVAIGGIVSFVGLVVPHLLRGSFGARHGGLLPACMLAGGAFVVSADIVARRAIAPEELELGVITAALGAPWFLLLLARRVRRASA